MKLEAIGLYSTLRCTVRKYGNLYPGSVVHEIGETSLDVTFRTRNGRSRSVTLPAGSLQQGRAEVIRLTHGCGLTAVFKIEDGRRLVEFAAPSLYRETHEVSREPGHRLCEVLPDVIRRTVAAQRRDYERRMAELEAV